MTDTDALRDRLAELTGWRLVTPEEMASMMGYVRPIAGSLPFWINGGGLTNNAHPFPPGDLTALAAVWPESSDITVKKCRQPAGEVVWFAKEHGRRVGGVMAASEFDARLRLTVAVLEARSNT